MTRRERRRLSEALADLRFRRQVRWLGRAVDDIRAGRVQFHRMPAAFRARPPDYDPRPEPLLSDIPWRTVSMTPIDPPIGGPQPGLLRIEVSDSASDPWRKVWP